MAFHPPQEVHYGEKKIDRRTFLKGAGAAGIAASALGFPAVARGAMMMKEGEKIAEGSPREISANRDVITAYLGEEYLAS